MLVCLCRNVPARICPGGTDVNIDNPLAECVDIHPVHRQEMDAYHSENNGHTEKYR
ncbi:DUF2195 family protein [Salmonella enterica subsp. enterica]|nr:DUF2195 family protein [Salmonella enterica subsp. enterica]